MALPDSLAEPILGEKRSLSQTNLDTVQALDQALSMNRYRDYAFTETVGGTKGEKVDYLMMDGGKTQDLGQLRYMPINSRVKLNKRFRTKMGRGEVMEEEEDEKKVKNIVIAPRALTKGEVAQIRSSFDLAGRPKEEMTKPMVPLFEKNRDVSNVEIQHSNALKSLFIIPKEFEGINAERRLSLEQDDAKMDDESDTPKRKVEADSENEDAGYSDSDAADIFGDQSQEKKAKPESKKSAPAVEEDDSEDEFADIF